MTIITKRLPQSSYPITRSLFVAAITVSGITLPLDFLSEIDGYLMYVKPWELFPIFGWSWLFYFILGLIIGAIVISTVLLFSFLLRIPKPEIPATVTATWLSLSIASLALMKAVRTWMRLQGFTASFSWQLTYHWPIVSAVLLLCAVAVFYKAQRFDGILSIACLGSSVGFVLTILAPFVTLAFNNYSSTSVHILSPAALPVERPPNIILITVDALAANHLSLYGYTRRTTPNLDKLAEQSHVFDRFYSNSNFTTPSVNSLINGVRPWTHRTNQLYAIVDPAISTQGLVARLKHFGYQTFAVASNPVADPIHNGSSAWLDKASYGNLRTLDLLIFSYFESHNFRHVTPALVNLTTFSRVTRIFERFLILIHAWSYTDHYDPELPLTSAKTMILQRNVNQPMFLWIHLFAPHEPYASPPPFLQLFDRNIYHCTRFNSTPPSGFFASHNKAFPTEFIGRYDEAIAYEDYHIGLFLQWLKGQGLYDNSILLVTADHGESFSHGYGSHAGPMLYDDIIRIPLIIKTPHEVLGERTHVLSEQIDIMPTLLNLAGLPITPAAEGRALLNSALKVDSQRPIYSMNFEQSSRYGHLETGSIAIIVGRWKYVHFQGRLHYMHMPSFFRVQPEQQDSLYDLLEDPTESRNLIANEPELAAQMRELISVAVKAHD